MDKFCSKCGKELVDGKCTCNEKKESIFTHIKEFVTKPVDTTNKFIENGSNEDSYLILLITSIVLAISTSTLLFKGIFIPFKLIVLTFIVIYLLFLGFTFIANLISKYIIKEEIPYEKTLKLVSISSISFILVGIIYYLIYYLFNILFLGLLKIGVLLFSITFAFGIKKISKIDENKIPYLLIATILSIVFIVNIIF